MEGCAELEGVRGAEGGAVSSPAWARPAENLGERGSQLRFAIRHGGAVVGGVEEKYQCCAAATESCSGRLQRRVAVAGESRRWMEERWSLPC